MRLTRTTRYSHPLRFARSHTTVLSTFAARSETSIVSDFTARSTNPVLSSPSAQDLRLILRLERAGSCCPRNPEPARHAELRSYAHDRRIRSHTASSHAS